MKYRPNEIKVGFVVVISFFLLLLFIIFLSGSGLWQNTKTYTIELGMSAGLQPGDLIRYGGLEVGRVIKVDISQQNPKKIEIVFNVDEKTPVRTDSIASLNYIGLLGSYYLEVSAGSEDAPLMKPGGRLQSRDIMQFSDIVSRVDSLSGIIENLFLVIDEKVTMILSDADEVLINVNRLLGDINQQKIQSILDNVDQIITTNAETIGGILENLRSMLAQVDALSHSLNNVVVKNETQIQETLILFQSLLQSGEAAVSNLDEIIGLSKDDIQHVINNTSVMSQRLADIVAEIHKNREHINTMLQNLNIITGNLREFSTYTDAEMGADAKKTLENIRVSSENLTLVLQRVQENNDSFEQILTNLLSASGEVSEFTTFLVDQRPALDATVGHVQNTAKNIDQLVTAVDREKITALVDHLNTIIATNTGTITNILEELQQIMSRVNTFSTSIDQKQFQETLGSLHAIVNSGEQIVKRFNNILISNRENVQTVIDNTTNFSTYLSELAAEVHQNKEKIQTMLQNVTIVSEHARSLSQMLGLEAKDDIRQTVANITATTGHVKFILERVQENNDQFEQLLTNLTSSSGNVSEFMAFMTDQQPHIAETMSYIRTTAQNIHGLSGTISGKQENIDRTIVHIEATAEQIHTLTQKAGDDWPQVSAILENIKTMSDQTKELMTGVNAKRTNIENIIVDVDAVSSNLKQLVEFANTQTPDIDLLLTNLNISLKSVMTVTQTFETNSPNLEAVFVNIKETTAELKDFSQFVNTRQEDLGAIFLNAREISDDVNSLTTTLETQSESIQQIIGNLTTTSGNIAEFSQFTTTQSEKLEHIIENIDGTLKELSEFVGLLNANKDQIASILTNTQETTANARSFSQKVAEGENYIEPILKNVEGISSQISTIATQFSAQSDKIAPILGNVSGITEDFKRFSEFIVLRQDDLQAALKNLRSTLQNFEDVSTILTENKSDIGDVVTGTKQTVHNVRTLTEHLNKSAPNIDTTVKNLVEISDNIKSFSVLAKTSRNKIAKIIDNLEDISQNLRQFSKYIKDNPWGMTRVVPKKERGLVR